MSETPRPHPELDRFGAALLERSMLAIGIAAVLGVFAGQLALPPAFLPSTVYALVWIALLCARRDLPRLPLLLVTCLLILTATLVRPPLGFLTQPITEVVVPLALVAALAWWWPATVAPPADPARATGDPGTDGVPLEHAFERIYASTQIGMARIGHGMRFVGLNNSFGALLRFGEHELLGRPLTAIAHPDDAETLREVLGSLSHGERVSFQQVVRCVRKDCKVIWINLAVSVVRDERGEIAFGLAMVEDITNARRVEERLRLREAEYAHASRLLSVGEMATGLAHEINQPLAAITNYAEASLLRARHGTVDLEALIDDLQQITAQAERASEIIRRLRTYLRKRETPRGRASLNAIIREVIEFTEFEARAREIEVDTDLGEIPAVAIDRIQIQQVLVNLVRNAVDAMSETPLDQRRLLLSSRHDENLIVIGVLDRGRGLPRGISERLFRPFFSTKPEGLGVGLSISRTIVEAHGGRMWAEPRLHGGTAFYFTLPVGRSGGESDPSDDKLVESHLGTS